MESITFRALKRGDECFAADVERQCLDTAWSEKQIAETLESENAFYAVALCDGQICGIGSIYCVAGDGQILNLAVLNRFRKKGIAKGIMDLLFKHALENGCESITLEVAENNAAAISLYTKCGYSVIARRKGFYKGIDALIMEKNC